MKLNKEYKQALNGFIKEKVTAEKNHFKISVIIMLVLVFISTFFMYLIMSRINNAGTASFGGFINYGFIIVFFALFGISSRLSSKKRILNSLGFPINRRAYALGSFITILICTFVLIAIVYGIGIAEMGVWTLLSHSIADGASVHYPNIISLIASIWIKTISILSIASLLYCIKLYFIKYKGKFAIIFAGIVAICSGIPIINSLLSEFISGIFVGDSNILYSSISILLMTIIFHLSAYIPLSKMEIN